MFAGNMDVAEDADRERSERHARMLRRLAEIGMNLAEAVEIQRQEDGADPADLAIKFARIAKAVRQTLALEARLADDDRVRQGAAEHRRKIERDRLTREAKQEGFFRKGQAGMLLEKAILAEDPDFDTEGYGDDIGEWLFDDSEAELYADRPVEEIVSEISRLLCVKYDSRAMDDALPNAIGRSQTPERGAEGGPDPNAGRPAHADACAAHPP